MLKGSNLAGGNSHYEKPDHDFYATDPATARLFLERVKGDGVMDFAGDWWECACGNGNISEVCRKYAHGRVYSSDIVDRGYERNFKVMDFLSCTRAPTDTTNVIITNPPFSLLADFLWKGLELTGRYLVIYAKIQTLESKERAALFKRHPPRYVYVHTERQQIWRNGESRMPDGRKWSTTMCMAWFVFDRNWSGNTELRFL